MVEIALFPIPNCVTFPGTEFPLHVFEPRYRTMIKHCLDNKMLLGICHTQKTVSPAKSEQALHEALQSNQATYKPFSIFSAGHCELLKTLDDGRMYLRIAMRSRYKAVKEIQTLPFSIYQCENYNDALLDATSLKEIKTLKQKILKRLQVMTSQLSESQNWLYSSEWTQKDPIKFSFEVFGLLQFDANLQQNFLEMTSPAQRLSELLEILNAY